MFAYVTSASFYSNLGKRLQVRLGFRLLREELGPSCSKLVQPKTIEPILAHCRVSFDKQERHKLHFIIAA